MQMNESHEVLRSIQCVAVRLNLPTPLFSCLLEISHRKQLNVVEFLAHSRTFHVHCIWSNETSRNILKVRSETCQMSVFNVSCVFLFDLNIWLVKFMHNKNAMRMCMMISALLDIILVSDESEIDS